MKIVLATNNMDKVREIKAYYAEFEVVALKEICKPFEIEENGISFYENAMIKARAVYAKIKELGLENEYIALSDDSGISVDALGGRKDDLQGMHFLPLNLRQQEYLPFLQKFLLLGKIQN